MGNLLIVSALTVTLAIAVTVSTVHAKDDVPTPKQFLNEIKRDNAAILPNLSSIELLVHIDDKRYEWSYGSARCGLKVLYLDADAGVFKSRLYFSDNWRDGNVDAVKNVDGT